MFVTPKTNGEWAEQREIESFIRNGGRTGYSKNLYDFNIPSLREASPTVRLAAQNYGSGAMNDLSKINPTAPQAIFDEERGMWCCIGPGVDGEKYAEFEDKEDAQHMLDVWVSQSKQKQPMSGKEDDYSKELLPSPPKLSKPTAKNVMTGTGYSESNRKAQQDMYAKTRMSEAEEWRDAFEAEIEVEDFEDLDEEEVGLRQESWRDPYIEELLSEGIKQSVMEGGAKMLGKAKSALSGAYQGTKSAISGARNRAGELATGAGNKVKQAAANVRDKVIEREIAVDPQGKAKMVRRLTPGAKKALKVGAAGTALGVAGGAGYAAGRRKESSSTALVHVPKKGGMSFKAKALTGTLATLASVFGAKKVMDAYNAYKRDNDGEEPDKEELRDMLEKD